MLSLGVATPELLVLVVIVEETVLGYQINQHRETNPCFPTDVYWLHSGCRQSVPVAADLHGRSDPPVHQQEDRRDASSHLCHS